MKSFDGGFFIESVLVKGAGLDDAELLFRDGLNVVEGASDTGKTYLANLIDFAFGASRTPREIQAAEGYERLLLTLVERQGRGRHQIERSLSGGDLILRRLSENGKKSEELVVSAKHGASNGQSISSFLLSLSGFSPMRVRRNKRGDTQELSFRNIAHLTIIDETRIIAEWPPHRSGSPVSATAENEVLRLVITGRPAAATILAPRKLSQSTGKVQAELLSQLEGRVREELGKLAVEAGDIEEEVALISESREALLKEYESVRVELVTRERERANLGRLLRDAESRVAVVEGLVARFELLDRHYESDIARLAAIQETGALLAEMPPGVCPVCGAVAAAHRPDEAAEHFDLGRVRAAAGTELEKTVRLRADLQNVLNDLRKEHAEKDVLRSNIRSELEELQANIQSELTPRSRSTVERLSEQDARREALMRASVLAGQLEELGRRREVADAAAREKKNTPKKNALGPSTGELDAFARSVEEVLAAWNYSEPGRVVFSETSQDLVIGGQERRAHGKGVRALSCSAFIVAILRHCASKGMAHSGLVVLDSPLVAYKEPDLPGSEAARFRERGVKEAFYRSLASGLCAGQVIIIENQEPPPDVRREIVHHHFSKSDQGRYGFFPRIGLAR